MKELILAGVLISVSTVLKICCVVALCSADPQPQEHEHDHHEVILAQRKQAQSSQQPMV